MKNQVRGDAARDRRMHDSVAAEAIRQFSRNVAIEPFDSVRVDLQILKFCPVTAHSAASSL